MEDRAYRDNAYGQCEDQVQANERKWMERREKGVNECQELRLER